MITYEQAQTILAMFGYMSGIVWWALDSVILIEKDTIQYSVLDMVLIGGAVFDIIWEYFEEIRG